MQPQNHGAAVHRHHLSYDRPAQAWTEALPLGNGKLGIMAFGGTAIDRFQINDETGWSGSPASNTVGGVVSASDAASAIENARTNIELGDFAAAADQLRRLQHRHSQSFLPFVDLEIHTDDEGEITEYSRVLDLERGSHVTAYRIAGHSVTRETIVSAPDHVAMIRIRSEKPEGLSLSISLTTVHRVVSAMMREDSDSVALAFSLPESVAPPVDEIDDPIVYASADRRSMPGAAVVRWSHDGSPGKRHRMEATGIHEATIWIATATTFVAIGEQPRGAAPDALAAAERAVTAAMNIGPDAVASRQRVDHTELYRRVDLELDMSDFSRACELESYPLDVRLIDANDSGGLALQHDPRLIELLFNFGRYLLICSSRAGGLPANLQGIWNDRPQPMWSSNYTTNINLEMNYWPAEVVGLGELAYPLFDLIDALALHGRSTAQRIYGAPGWVAHHNTDPWAYTQPVGWGKHDPRWAFWPLAGAWLIRHLWEHVQFGADDDFARDRAWPVIHSAAEFYLDWLVVRPDRTLGTSPSTSPENTFVAPDGTIGSVDVSSTLDLTLIADLFDIVADLAELLDIEDPIVERAQEARRRIPDPSPGRDGLIREWLADRPQHETDHRHVSHLYFVYPGARTLTPELVEAAGASLDARGGEATGWSVAWKLALEARLHRPEKISELLALAVRDMRVDRGDWVGGLYPNLFAAHPPFQIDANFGIVAGIAECLLQSHHGRIELLPSVPEELGSGRVSGLIARPGVSVSMRWHWESGVACLDDATFVARTLLSTGTHEIVLGERTWQIELSLGVPYFFRAETLPTMESLTE